MFDAARIDPPLVEPLTDATGERTTAMILGVALGAVVYEEMNGGGTYARGQRKLKLRVEPAEAPAYEAELLLEPEETMVPARPGTRLPVLVDPEDPKRLALPTFNRWFALPGGIVWQPPPQPAYGLS